MQKPLAAIAGITPVPLHSCFSLPLCPTCQILNHESKYPYGLCCEPQQPVKEQAEFLRRPAGAKSITLQLKTKHSDASYASVKQPLLVWWSLKESSIYCLAAWETFGCPWGSL